MVIEFMFVDDNTDEQSKALLTAFQLELGTKRVFIEAGDEKSTYVCDDESHHWTDDLMHKVARYKNRIIDYAIEKSYDYLFFVDSDLILRPNLIEHLMKAQVAIVSEIFWSQWHPNRPLEPNVWLFDEYDLVPKQLNEALSASQMASREKQFLNQLKHPGLYEVGGLGACTLLSRAALIKGVNFEPISNLTIHGEDRFFCIRAAVLGLKLHVDTHYPAYHIYRECDLEGVSAYVEMHRDELTFKRHAKESGNQLTLSMCVKNESGRYLERLLTEARPHIDGAVIIDDGSTDDTIAICERILRGIPYKIVSNEESKFYNEVSLRQQQWDETVGTNPDWILNLDADEVVEPQFWNALRLLINDPRYDQYALRLYDMWSDTHYREDTYWNAHKVHRVFLMRYQPEFNYKWHDSLQHCGRFPNNLFDFPLKTINHRVQHFGWATLKDRTDKYERYQRLDPDGIFGIQAQYDSILSETPQLIEWVKEENQ